MVCHHGFSTAHAVPAEANGRDDVVPVNPEAAEEATVTDADKTEWCTDSQEDQEEPHRRKVSGERQRDHQDDLQEVPRFPSALFHP